MPKDCDNRQTGSRARAIVHYKLNSKHWDYKEETGNDVGRDCILELAYNGTWNNDKIEGQIKGTENLKLLKNNDISFQLSTKTINYALASSNSFLLFLVDVNTENTYYLNIQDYFIENPKLLSKLFLQKSINVHIKKANIVTNDDSKLIEMARRVYYIDDKNNLRYKVKN